jgi:hypothetical protein
VICEYNSLFGAKRAVTIPYDKRFERHKAHYSGGYFGASIAALAYLASRKGYSLVGSNSTGANAFFVQSSILGDIATQKAEQAYVKSQFRDSRDPDGRLTFASFEERLAMIAHLPVVDVEDSRAIKVQDLDGPGIEPKSKV